MAFHRFSIIIGTVFVLLAVSANGQDDDLTGVWKTSIGTMTVEQNGNRIALILKSPIEFESRGVANLRFGKYRLADVPVPRANLTFEGTLVESTVSVWHTYASVGELNPNLPAEVKQWLIGKKGIEIRRSLDGDSHVPDFYLNVAGVEWYRDIHGTNEISRIAWVNEPIAQVSLLTVDYPHLEPIVPLRYVFSATVQPPLDKINGRESELLLPPGKQSPMVLVIGPDIIGESGQLQVESVALGIRAVPIAVKEADVHPDVESMEPFDSGFGRVVKDLPMVKRDQVTSMDAAFVQFVVDAGVLPGAKRFVINGVEGDWILQRGTATAHMLVARSDWDGSHHQTDVAYHYDEIEIAVKSSAPVDIKQLEVIVMVDDKKAVLVGMESLVLKNNGQGLTFTSDPIRIAPNKVRAKKMGGPAIVAGEYSQITLVTGLDNEFISQPATSLMVYVTPARMLRYYPVIKSTTAKKTSYLWKEALQEAANLAGKEVVDWADLTAEEAGEVSNFIVTELGNRTVQVTVAQHAAMILLRRLFIEQMTQYLYTVPKVPDPQFLRLWREMVRPHANDPNFGPAMVKVTPSGYKGKMTYGSSFTSIWGSSITLIFFPSTVPVEDRQAFLGWRQAVIDSINIARDTDIDDIEDMVELTGEGFGPVVKMLLPRLVKLEERGASPELVWVPDELARLAAESIETIGDQARAIDAVGSADTAVVIAAASLVLFTPATVPTKILSLAIESGMAIEAGSLVFDYFDSIDAVDLAFGAGLILGGDRLNAVKARAIPGWGVTLAVFGSVLGLGAETYGLISSVRVARSIDRAIELIPELEKGGLDAFQALSREDQVSVLTAVTSSKSAQESRVLRFDPKRARVDEYGTNLQREIDAWFETVSPGQFRSMDTAIDFDEILSPVGFRSRGTAIDFDETLLPGNTKFPKKGSPAVGSKFRIMGPDGPEDVVLERFLGQGTFADVYSIKGDSKRVVKICTDVHHKGTLYRTGKDSVLSAQRVQKLLKDRGVLQLEILHFAPDARQPYMIQAAIEPGKHHIFNRLKRKETSIINGIKYQKSVPLGIRSDLTPDGEFPPEVQRAILRLFKKLGNAKIDNVKDPLIWEDGHIGNIFLVKDKVGPGYSAGILDQDRIARFANIPDDEKLSHNVFGIGWKPTFHKIESLRNRIKPENWAEVVQRRGSLSPDADYFMAKMLEYGGRYIRYNRNTGKFEKILLDPKIVEEFFPNLKQWIDPDLSHLRGANRVLQFPIHVQNSIGLINEVGSEVLVGAWTRKAA